MSYTDFDFPHTAMYTTDLREILARLMEITKTLNNFINLNTIKYANPIQWNITTQYEANTVVIDANDGTAYLSVQPVPTGVAITNTDYWTPIFTLNLLSANQNITLRDDGSNVLATFASSIGDWLIWNNTLYKVTQAIAVNEAYVVGYNLTRYSVELFIKDYMDAIITTIGDLDDLNTTDKSNVVAAINEVLQNLTNTIGELSDLNTTDKTNVVAAINEVLDGVTSNKTRYVFVDTSNVDITDAIVSAIASANDGDIVYLPDGNYTISDYIDIAKNVNIIFDGTITSVDGTFNNVNKALFNFNGVSDVVISLKVSDPNYLSTCNVIRLVNCHNVRVQNCFIDIRQIGYDGCAAINIGTDSHDIAIERCFLRAEYGILANDYSGIYNIYINNNVFRGGRAYNNVTHGDAIEFNTPTYGSDNIVVTNNEASEFEWNATYARTITFGFANAHNIRIANNHIYDCDTAALHFENGCNKVAIVSNIIDNIYQGINIIANTTRFNQDFDISNNIIKAYGKITNHDVDTGFAIVLNTGSATSLGFNCRINITNNNLVGGTDSSNGLCVYNGLDIIIANNIIRNFARSGLDICVYSATTGPGIQNVNCHDNDISLCGWSARLGLRSYNATPYTIPNLVFKNNSLKGSTFNINIMSCLGSSGIHDVEYRAQTGNSNYYSVGDIVINDPTDLTTAAGRMTHKYCSVAGTPTSATLVGLY